MLEEINVIRTIAISSFGGLVRWFPLITGYTVAGSGKGKIMIIRKSMTVLFASLVFSFSGYAAQRIAILNFELNDITSLPNTPQEQARTASFRPLLEQAMINIGDYEM